MIVVTNVHHDRAHWSYSESWIIQTYRFSWQWCSDYWESTLCAYVVWAYCLQSLCSRLCVCNVIICKSFGWKPTSSFFILFESCITFAMWVFLQCLAFSLHPFFKILPYTEEHPIPNLHEHSDVFNNTSVHFFPEHRLCHVSEEFWLDNPEPQYPEDVEIELQTKWELLESSYEMFSIVLITSGTSLWCCFTWLFCFCFLVFFFISRIN